MIDIAGESLNEVFVAACRAVLRHGDDVAPRGLATREVLGAHLCLTDPSRRLLDLPGTRVLNPAFAMAETMWILSGTDEPWIYAYNGALRQFADDGILRGAYGPRMRRWTSTSSSRGAMEPNPAGVDQLDAVRRLLIADPDSRRAAIQLFDPATDFLGHRDVPCTLGYRFYLRRRRLHMHTTMRSQDLWLGFGYDVFAATVLQELLAGWLGVAVGEYHHHVDSLHLYAPVLEQAAALPERAPTSERVAVPALSWERFDHCLRDVLGDAHGPSPRDRQRACGEWQEASLVLRSYTKWKLGDHDTARADIRAATGTMVSALGRWYEHLDVKRDGAVGAAGSAARRTRGAQ